MRLELRSLAVERAGVRVVDGVDLDVEAGEWIGLIGPNGAGKSSLLEAIAGVVAHQGVVAVDGVDMAAVSRSRRARAVALVPQRPVFPPGMALLDYVLLGRTPHLGPLGAERHEDVVSANLAISTVGLDALVARPVDSLSGGEAQRAAVARALAQASPVLLLDEPTSALDVGVRMEVLDRIDEIRASCGLTVLSAVHDLTLAAQFCDRLVMLSGGHVVATGPASGVLTADAIGAHFGATVRVVHDDEGGIIVIPLRPDSRQRPEGDRMWGPDRSGAHTNG